jgi:hypothetical protein
MQQTITLQLSDEMVRRFRRGAAVAHKPLEQFIEERLLESVPPLADELPPEIRVELEGLEALDNEALWQAAQSQLSTAKQKRYSQLLAKNRQGMLTAVETETLHRLGDESRRLTLKKAHAYLLLRWRGQNPTLPLIDMA